MDGAKTYFCDALCAIRKCAMSKGVETCGACPEMAACETLAAITANNPMKLMSLAMKPVAFEDDLMEFNNGIWAGLPETEVDEKYPMPENLPLHDAVYEQESMLEFRGRAERMLSKIVTETTPNEIVAVVTHGGIINQLYYAFFRLPVDSNYRFQTGDTGYHVWLIDKDIRAVSYANRLEHLHRLEETKPRFVRDTQ